MNKVKLPRPSMQASSDKNLHLVVSKLYQSDSQSPQDKRNSDPRNNGESLHLPLKNVRYLDAPTDGNPQTSKELFYYGNMFIN